MKKTLFALTAIVTLILSFTSCRKDDKLTTDENKLSNILAKAKSPEQVFKVNGATGGTITGIGTSKITFPPNFARKPDNSVYLGDAVVTLRESLTKKQWLADGLSTTTATGMLESGGMISLEARADNGEVLILNPALTVPNTNLNAVVQADMPRRNANALDSGMRLFLPEVAGAVVNPNAPIQVQAWRPAQMPFNNSATRYNFQIPGFGWANCDRLYSYPGAKTTISVRPDISGVTGATALRVLLVFKNINTIISLPPETTNFVSYTNSIPVGGVADVVILGENASGDAIFKVISNNTFTAAQIISIKPELATATTIEAYLNSF